MSQKTTLIVQTGPERFEDGRPTYDVRLLPNDESIAQLEGRHMPEIRLQVYRENPNKYTERYVVEGSMMANIDKTVSARLLAVAACMAASKLHGGRESFLEQGFTAEVLSGVDGLIDYTYEAAGDIHTRLVSTTVLSALVESLAEAGYEFPIAKQAKSHSEVPGLDQIKATHNAEMTFSNQDGDTKVYDVRVLKQVTSGEQDEPFVLAQVRVTPIELDDKTYDLALISVMTVGYDLAPWSNTDAAMVAAQCCMGLVPIGHPLLVGFDEHVVAEYQLQDQLMPREETQAHPLYDVRLVAAKSLDEYTTGLALKGMQMSFTKPDWVH